MSSCRSRRPPRSGRSRRKARSARLKAADAASLSSSPESPGLRFTGPHAGSGPQLIWGPNAAGKTTLLEGIVLLALGRSHRTAVDAELIRWGADFLRVEGVVGVMRTEEAPSAPEDEPGVLGAALDGVPPPGIALNVSLQAGGRKRILVNGVPRRPRPWLSICGPSSSRPRRCSSSSARRPCGGRRSTSSPGRTIRCTGRISPPTRVPCPAQQPAPADPRRRGGPCPAALLGRAVPGLGRSGSGGPFAAPGVALSASGGRSPRDRPGGGAAGAGLRHDHAALPGESPRDALARRLRETAEKEAWNGTTLVGPHRDDLVFRLGGRDLTTFASRGQQRTAILALKLAEMDLLTALDGRPRCSCSMTSSASSIHCAAATWSAVLPGCPRRLSRRLCPTIWTGSAAAGARLAGGRGCRGNAGRGGRGVSGQRGGVGPGGPGREGDRGESGGSGRRGMERLGDLLPDAARQLGLEDELELAAAMTAWQRIVAERVPPAVGACRVVALSQGVVQVEADEPIVAQELRLRARSWWPRCGRPCAARAPASHHGKARIIATCRSRDRSTAAASSRHDRPPSHEARPRSRVAETARLTRHVLVVEPSIGSTIRTRATSTWS